MILKTINIILPTIAGLGAALIFLQVYNQLNPDPDSVLSLQPFDINIFYPLYLILLAVAIAFQYFAALPVRKMYLKGETVFRLKLWQLTGIVCLIFGIVSGYYTWYSGSGMMTLLWKVLFAEISALMYWLINLAFLAMIRNNKRFQN